MPRYYPVCLDLEGKFCLVVGGGKIAERKIVSLLDYGAKVRVVSPKVTREITDLFRQGKIWHEEREFQVGDLTGVFLVIAATNIDQINKGIAREAQRHGLLINVVDAPADSTFILPAVLKRGDLAISISTGGKSPALARKMRQDMETQYGQEYEILVDILGGLRADILRAEPDIEKRKGLFQRLAESDELLRTIREHGREAAEKKARELL
ncbi:MAG: bifunctional precorrin-2 dehydrogenase/sirohydrochlorin ferrochelatase [bacterium]